MTDRDRKRDEAAQGVDWTRLEEVSVEDIADDFVEVVIWERVGDRRKESSPPPWSGSPTLT
jgi:hypothetical protein